MYTTKGIIVNIITVSRAVVVIPIFFIDNFYFLFIVTVWAGFSDFLDGYLARKWQETSAFGVRLDQYADKTATLFLLAFFLKNQQLDGLLYH